eukprot:COSAG06_NODE_47873_length_336_cov_0.797468_2_plen_61_part_01
MITLDASQTLYNPSFQQISDIGFLQSEIYGVLELLWCFELVANRLFQSRYLVFIAKLFFVG